MSRVPETIVITDLTEQLDLREAVTDRIWNAWWKDEGYSFKQIDERLAESLGPEPIPTALVASIDGKFVGTVSLIEDDFSERPDYTPWVAALWVEPQHRGQSIGASLIACALACAFEAGFDTVYLCANEDNSPLYRSLGWRQIEENVSGLNIFSYERR